MEKALVIIDGNSLMNRAYYAIQRPMITGDGMYTQGIFGFLNMLNKILTDYEPEYISVAFDRKAPTFRHLEYKEYKAGRKKMPPELAMQFPVLKEILSAMKIDRIEIDGFEADDIIGTVAVTAEREGLFPLIITGDRDALQLATDVTKIIFTKRGITEFEVYDRQAMIDRYGLTPQQFIDLKGLMGDASDNIPGIPGVGEKTATKLLLEYGSVENIIASVGSMKKSKLKEKIEENAQMAVMSKRLATINTNVPLNIDFEELRYEEPDSQRLIELYKRLEFNSFLRKMAKSSGGASIRTENSSEEEGVFAEPGSPKLSAGFSGALEGTPAAEQFAFLYAVSPSADIVRADTREKRGEMKDDLSRTESLWLKIFHDNAHVTLPEISSVCIASSDTVYYIPWTEEAAADGISEVQRTSEAAATRRIRSKSNNCSCIRKDLPNGSRLSNAASRL